MHANESIQFLHHGVGYFIVKNLKSTTQCLKHALFKSMGRSPKMTIMTQILHLLLTKKVRLNSKLFILMIICWPWFGLMWTVYVIQVRFVPVMGHFDTDSSGVELFHPHKGHGTTNLLFGLLCSPDTGSGMCISINNYINHQITVQTFCQVLYTYIYM